MLVNLFIAAALLISTGTPAAQAVASGDDAATTDYAGWAYSSEGWDFPLRLHVTRTAGGLSASVDLPAERAYGLEAKSARVEGDKLIIERTRKNGKAQRFEITTRPPHRGQMRSEGDDPIDIEFTAAEEPLPHVNPEEYRARAGLYSDGERSVIIEPWGWGELRYSEFPSGARGTLFARSAREFFIGPAEYVPAPVQATLTFAGPSAQPDHLLWIAADGAKRKLPRTAQPREELVTFRNGAVSLEGALLLPTTPPPHRAVVMLGGSNWTTRDSVGRDATMFALMGLAVLTYDQRGYGESTGEPICSFADTAADARAAVAHLRSRADIRKDCVGLSGRSRGGWFAPLAAAETADIAWVVLHVPPAVSPAVQEHTRRMNLIRAGGYSEADVAEAERYLELLWEATRSDDAWTRYVAMRDRTSERPWRILAGATLDRDSDDYRWEKLNMHYDPLPTLRRVRCPVLALFGEKDDNVTVAQNLKAMEDALRKAGNSDVTLRVVPNVGHGLTELDADGSSPRIHRARGYAPGMWQDVQTWLDKRCPR